MESSRPKQETFLDSLMTGAPSGVPYRTELRTLIDEEVREINKQEGHAGARKYSNPDTAIGKARTAKSANRDNFESYIYHPDERVPIALLDNTNSPNPLYERYGESYNRLPKRAVEEAQQEGVLWTPLLDRLSSDSRFGQAMSRSSSHVVIEKLLEWVRTRTSVEDLRGLFRFQSEHLMTQIGENLPFMTPELFELSTKSPWTLVGLARNEQVLDTDLARRLRLWALKTLRKSSSRTGYTSVEYKVNSHARIAGHVINGLLVSGQGVDDRLYRRLFGLMTRTIPESEEVTELPSIHYSQHSGRYSTWAAVAKALTFGGRTVPVQVQQELYSRVQKSPEHIKEIISSAHTALETKRHIAKDSSIFSVREALMKDPASMEDEEIRDVLHGSTSKKAILALLKDAEGSEYVDLFTKLKAKDEEAATRVFVEYPEKSSALPSDVVKGLLLTSPKRKTKKPLTKHVKKVMGGHRYKTRSLLLIKENPHFSEELKKETLEELKAELVRYARTEHSFLKSLLKEHSETLASILSRTDLKHVLSSEDRELRMLALTLLGSIEKPPASRNQPRPNK